MALRTLDATSKRFLLTRRGVRVPRHLVGGIGAGVLVALLWPGTYVRGGPSTAVVLPGRLGAYVNRHVQLTSAQYTTLSEGKAVTKLLDADASKEVAVFGAIWIDAPMSTYLAAARDIERLENGANFLVTKKISNPPRPEDFAQLTLPAEDVDDLKTCKVGDCELKLGEDALRQMKQQVDWTAPRAEATRQLEAILRRMALEYVTAYERDGDKALAAYRDTKRPTFVAQEFRSMIDAMPVLTDYLHS
jgi:hypothetical protein